MARIGFVLILLLWSSIAHAERRVALVIGNRDYKASVGPLANPLNDIRLVGDALRSVGFEVLNPIENASRIDMLRAIYGLATVLKDAGPDAVGFLYYSGHGLASAGENYLVPIDVIEPSTLQLSIQGVKQSEVLDILRREAPNAAHYLGSTRAGATCRAAGVERVLYRSDSRVARSLPSQRSQAKRPLTLALEAAPMRQHLRRNW
jgi:hypothetical protein